MKRNLFIAAVSTALLIIPGILKAQQTNLPVSVSTAGPDRWGRPGPAVGAWTDPALNHNKLIQNTSGDGTFKLIGPYKVKGTPFLYGEHHKGDMFAPEAKAYNIYVSYNTYNQEVEFYSTSNPSQPLVREPGSLDSFIIQENGSIGIAGSLKFIYGSHLGVKEKAYFLELYSGSRFSLYKKYKSDLGYVSDNIAQPDLRQFDLLFDYYYIDTEKKGMKKLKSNFSVIVSEFNKVKDLSTVTSNDDFTLNPEESMRKMFKALNH